MWILILMDSVVVMLVFGGECVNLEGGSDVNVVFNLDVDVDVDVHCEVDVEGDGEADVNLEMDCHVDGRGLLECD